jgi:hypothetical protein
MNRLAFLLLLLTASAPAQAAGDVCALPRAHAETGVEILAWLAGDWVETKGDLAVREHWSGPFAGTLLGTGITTKGEATKSYEFFRIAKTAQGVSYFASPNAAPATEFKATIICSDKVVFENKAHDFPQRVIYERGPGGTLNARVEGLIQGKLEAQDWRYKSE